MCVYDSVCVCVSYKVIILVKSVLTEHDWLGDLSLALKDSALNVHDKISHEQNRLLNLVPYIDCMQSVNWLHTTPVEYFMNVLCTAQA